MVRSAEDRCVEDVERLLAARLDGLELLHAAVERYRKLVPFDWYCANVADPICGLTTGAALAPGLPVPTHAFFDRYYFDEYVPTQRRMAQDRRLALSLSEETSQRPELAPRYRDWMVPSGYADELVMTCVAGEEIWGTVSIMRAAARSEFTPAETRLARRLAAILGVGLRAASINGEHGYSETDEGGMHVRTTRPGVLVLDPGGRLIRHTRRAARLLAEIDHLSPFDWAEGNELPIAVSVLAAAAKRAPRVEDRLEDAACSLRLRGHGGRWVTLEAELTEPGPHVPAEITIVLRPTPPQEMAQLKAAAYGLTTRERQVVDEVTRGGSTAEIARVLYLSEYTVQEHLQNVFEKVGVSSRRVLLRRLLFDDPGIPRRP